jgi:hypothetical protein
MIARISGGRCVKRGLLVCWMKVGVDGDEDEVDGGDDN